ncbi:hypothetical protein Bca4012_005718 [Brassica carinata]
MSNPWFEPGRRLGVRHSTFESLRLGRSSQSIAYVVGQICSVQGSSLTKETTRVVFRLLIDP